MNDEKIYLAQQELLELTAMYLDGVQEHVTPYEKPDWEYSAKEIVFEFDTSAEYYDDVELYKAACGILRQQLDTEARKLGLIE